MKNLSLYAVEFCSDGDFDNVYSAHSFFALVDETGARPKILGELHFWRAQDQEQPDKWRINSQVRGEGRPIDYRLAMGGHIGGKEDFIQGEWNRAVEYAKTFDGMVVDNSDPMSPKTHDCRAGVKTVVEYLGLDFYHVKEAPGTDSGSDASLEELIPGN